MDEILRKLIEKMPSSLTLLRLCLMQLTVFNVTDVGPPSESKYWHELDGSADAIG